jgi:F-type H+/Na+-transporting ATPase subunit alpha
MQISAAEISQIIKKQIQDFDRAAMVTETGTVLSCGDGIARIYGLEGAMAGELVELPGDVFAMVLNLEQDNVGVAILGDPIGIKEGALVKRTGRKVVLERKQDPTLIAGVVTRIGDNIIDGTIHGHLEALERELLSA